MPFIESVLREQVATITLNRPEKLNAFAGTMREELLHVLREADADRACRVIVITGAGRAFSAGGDVEFMTGLQKNGDVTSFRALLEAGRDIVLQIVEASKPVIASVNGVAAGAGCNLALACDYRIASDTAKLSQAFVKIGLHPDWGGTWLLPRVVGRSRAFEIMSTGRLVSADEAFALGVLDRIVPAADLASETARLAEAIAAGPPLAIGAMKRALAASEIDGLRRQLDLETENQLRMFLSADAAEGLASFFEKRPPEFKGE